MKELSIHVTIVSDRMSCANLSERSQLAVYVNMSFWKVPFLNMGEF